jgi:hypothetical protein
LKLGLVLLIGAAVLSVHHARGEPPKGVAPRIELSSLELALEIFAVDTGYYVALEALNDLDVTPTNPPYDYIYYNDLRVVDINKGLFSPLVFSMTNPLPGWFGPYATYQPGKTQIGPSPYDEGSPLDPWGRPYYFFTPLGLVRGDTGAITLELYGDQFDRYTLVSLGPDGVVSNDDGIRQFGTGVSSLSLSSISGPDVFHLNYRTGTVFVAANGATLTLKGYFFGSSQGTSKVRFGAVELTDVTSWSSSYITVNLPLSAVGTELVTVQVGAAVSNGLQLTVNANSALDWEIYE